MSDYRVISPVTGLPPTDGIEDARTRQFLDALKNQLDERSGLGKINSGERFVTKKEIGALTVEALTQVLAPAAGGVLSGVSMAPVASSAQINRLIEGLAEAITRSLVYQKLEAAFSLINIGSVRTSIDQVQTQRSDKDNALASAINTIWASIGGAAAVIQDGALAAVTPSAVQATKWTQVQAAVTDPNTGLVNSTSIKQDLVSYANAANGKFNSIYSVRAQVSVGGQTVVGGFGLSASNSTGGAGGPAGEGATIDFGVRADRFFIAATSATPDAATQIAAGSSIPFMVLTYPQWVNGVVYPAGVYMKKAVIGQAAIGTAEIADAAINTAKIGLAQITTALIGDAQINTLQLAGQAVTFPASAFTAAVVACGDSVWTDLQSVVAPAVTGAPVHLVASAVIEGSSYHRNVQLRLLRNGTQVALFFLGTFSGYSMPATVQALDTPPAGYTTYTLQVYYNLGIASIGLSTSSRAILMLEVKR